MSEFDDLPPPAFEPAAAVAMEMNKLLTSASPEMGGEAAAFTLGALQMGRNILVALSMSPEEIGWAKELEEEARRQHRLRYESRKPQFKAKGGAS